MQHWIVIDSKSLQTPLMGLFTALQMIYCQIAHFSFLPLISAYYQQQPTRPHKHLLTSTNKKFTILQQRHGSKCPEIPKAGISEITPGRDAKELHSALHPPP